MDAQSHVKTGGSCLVGHYGDDGEILPGCFWCARCHGWVRPEALDEPCDGTRPPDPEPEWRPESGGLVLIKHPS